MKNSLFSERLEAITQRGDLRQLPKVEHNGMKVSTSKHENMLNLSSNDYLGLATDEEFTARFWAEHPEAQSSYPLSSSSSRLLTGNFEIYERVEARLSQLYGTEAALIFGSGYHANMGILPALTTSQSLILADKLVHASLIDGIRLSKGKAVRYRHNDYEQLEELLAQHAHKHDIVAVVTESVFSMDGDTSDLARLVAMKSKYPNMLLYVDEAHAVGAMGERGLGYSEVCGVTSQIDILVGTFGKALASTGAFVVCTRELREWLVNTMRTLIFTTALPPINLLWTLYVLDNIEAMGERRQHLALISEQLRDALGGSSQISNSHIIPVIAGESPRAVAMADQLQNEGYYILAIRPPTVPEGTSRLRVSLTAAVTQEALERFIPIINSVR